MQNMFVDYPSACTRSSAVGLSSSGLGVSKNDPDLIAAVDAKVRARRLDAGRARGRVAALNVLACRAAAIAHLAAGLLGCGQEGGAHVEARRRERAGVAVHARRVVGGLDHALGVGPNGAVGIRLAVRGGGAGECEDENGGAHLWGRYEAGGLDRVSEDRDEKVKYRCL